MFGNWAIRSRVSIRETEVSRWHQQTFRDCRHDTFIPLKLTGAGQSPFSGEECSWATGGRGSTVEPVLDNGEFVLCLSQTAASNPASARLLVQAVLDVNHAYPKSSLIPFVEFWLGNWTENRARKMDEIARVIFVGESRAAMKELLGETARGVSTPEQKKALDALYKWFK